MFCHRFVNTPRVMVCNSNWWKLENMKTNQITLIPFSCEGPWLSPKSLTNCLTNINNWNLCQTYFLEVGPMQIPTNHETHIVYHVEIYIDFPYMAMSLGPRWSELQDLDLSINEMSWSMQGAMALQSRVWRSPYFQWKLYIIVFYIVLD